LLFVTLRYLYWASVCYITYLISKGLGEFLELPPAQARLLYLLELFILFIIRSAKVYLECEGKLGCATGLVAYSCLK
jgi:hypothetical protein